MPNYDWREHRGLTWYDRFPRDVRGYTVWRQQWLEPRVDLKRLAEEVIEARERSTAGPPRACLFVSHRQSDVNQASRIAYLACKVGFDYWLDVLDPILGGVLTASEEEKAAATAAVIEMALLNSTHVLAVMTSNTKGSQWVPYEYGRVKEGTAKSLQAACWLERSLAHTALPEYLYLGPILKSEVEIVQWLQAQLAIRFGSSYRDTCTWTSPIPAAL
jgi:hypothetical protein